MNSPSIITRFFFRELFGTTLIATFALTGILLYGNAVRSHEQLFQALAVSPSSFFELIGFLVPYSLSYGLPFGFVIAVLFCFGKWSADKEILALRSLGLGIRNWGKPVFVLSFLLSLISLYANLQWAPMNRAKFDQKKEEVMWDNLRFVLEREGEVEFNLDEDLNQESAKSLESFAAGKLAKVSLSVGEIGASGWNKLRIIIFGENEKLHSIVHARRGIVRKSREGARIVMDLKHVDVENIDLEGDEHSWSSGRFVSFERWKNPLVLDLITQDGSQNLKRMGVSDLYAVSSSRRPGDEQRRGQARVLLQKNFALGLSPFFLSFLLLPLSILKGKGQALSNVSLGIFVAVAYFGIGSLLSGIQGAETLSFIAWWIPNGLCLFFGLIMLTRYEKAYVCNYSK